MQSGSKSLNRKKKIIKANSTRLYSIVDLFAGCGGLALGFENAGFTPVFMNELNNDARNTYLINRNHSLGGLPFRYNTSLHSNDINELGNSRLNNLISDFENIPEMGFTFDRDTSPAVGGGSSLDVLTGGPPCQGFSPIGVRRSYVVERKDIPSNRLFDSMATVIEKLRPRIFLFENVYGLTHARWTRNKGSKRIFPNVLSRFRSISGYEVRWSVVSAKNYGVPQNRPRLLLVGIRMDVIEACDRIDPNADANDAVECGFLPSGIPRSFPNLVDLLGDLVDENVDIILRSGKYPKGPFESTFYPSRIPNTPIQTELRRVPTWFNGADPILTDQVYSKHYPRIVDKYAFMIANNGMILEEHRTKKFNQKVLPRIWGDREPSITVMSIPDDYVHFCQPRNLTVREWARLQLFPDWYRFTGNRTTGGIKRAGNPREGIFERELPKYTQIGNAVPVRLAESLGHHFKDILHIAYQ